MAEKLGVEKSVKTILEFCGEQLKQLGIEAYVFFAEIDKDIYAVGKSDFKFDLELIKLILHKNNIVPQVFTGESLEDVKEKVKKKIEEIYKTRKTN